MKIQSTANTSTSRLKFLIYGEPGVGKTTLASTIKDKTLIISAEAGLLSIADHDIDVIDLTVNDNGETIPKEKRAERLGEVFQYLLSKDAKEKYDWIFLDSLTEISQNMIEALQATYTDPKDTIKMWGDYAKKARGLIKTFRDLPYYNVVFTALTDVDKDENNRRYTRPGMQGKIGKNLAGFFDEVFFMYSDEEKEDVPFLLTHAKENVQAKDRSGKLERIEPANLQLIANKIKAKKSTTKQKVKGE